MLARLCRSLALRIDLQPLATILAVNRIRAVSVQAAFRAFMLDLGGWKMVRANCTKIATPMTMMNTDNSFRPGIVMAISETRVASGHGYTQASSLYREQARQVCSYTPTTTLVSQHKSPQSAICEAKPILRTNSPVVTEFPHLRESHGMVTVLGRILRISPPIRRHV